MGLWDYKVLGFLGGSRVSNNVSSYEKLPRYEVMGFDQSIGSILLRFTGFFLIFEVMENPDVMGQNGLWIRFQRRQKHIIHLVWSKVHKIFFCGPVSTYVYMFKRNKINKLFF